MSYTLQHRARRRRPTMRAIVGNPVVRFTIGCVAVATFVGIVLVITGLATPVGERIAQQPLIIVALLIGAAFTGVLLAALRTLSGATGPVRRNR